MKTLFIINPKSGTKALPKDYEVTIKNIFPSAQIRVTEYKNHARQIAAQAVKDGFSKVVAVGGDGTINEVVQSLAYTKVVLGVIPRGSGNGLAREFGIPLDNFASACKTIATAKEVVCDLGKANDDYFINLAGLGLEANIAHTFDICGKNGKRGRLPYFEIGLKEVFNYRPPQVEIIADGEAFSPFALTVVFTNGRQYGSNLKIAPQASFTDGFLDMVIIEKQNILKLLAGLPNLFIDGISPVGISKTKKISLAQISSPSPFAYHIDGEPKTAQGVLKISVCKGAIKTLMV